MGPMNVVVADVASENTLEVALIEDEEVVETFGTDGSHELLGVGVRIRSPIRGREGLGPALANTSLKPFTYFVSRSRRTNRTAIPAWSRAAVTLRAC